MSVKNSKAYKLNRKLVSAKILAAGFPDQTSLEVIGYRKVPNPARSEKLKELEEIARKQIDLLEGEAKAIAAHELANASVKYDATAPETLTYALYRAVNPFRRMHRRIMGMGPTGIKNFLSSELMPLTKPEETELEKTARKLGLEVGSPGQPGGSGEPTSQVAGEQPAVSSPPEAGE